MRIVFFIEDYVKGGHNVVVTNIINNWPTDDELILISNSDNLGLDLIKRRLRRKCNIYLHKFNYDNKINNLKVLPPFKYFIKIIVFILRYPILILQLIKIENMLKIINPRKFIISNGGYPGGQTCRAAALIGLFSNKKWGNPFFIIHNIPVSPRFLIIPIEFIVDWLINKNVKNFITVSNAVKSKISNRAGLRNSNKIIVIHNGIDRPPNPTKLSEVSIRKELGLSKSDKLVLTIANFEKRKGHEFIFNVMAKVCKLIPNVKLLLAGADVEDYASTLNKKIIDLGLKEYVHFLGFRNNIPELLRQVDVLAVPSQAYESFGLINVEAMAMKIPVVATNVGGIPEVVEDGITGYLCEPSNINIYAEKLVELLINNEKRISLGEAGYTRFNAMFRSKIMSENYFNLINST